jgi:hypothetical protein
MTLAQLRHPHVVQFLGASLRTHQLALVTEYLPHSLHGVLYGTPAVPLDWRRCVTSQSVC